uniref:Secreted protein n=1 Tax=Romanomermis culicivorax TaxID=13658 RepID=A0A915L3E1_ROMCU
MVVQSTKLLDLTRLCCTLTATVVPSFNFALWTWANEAAPIDFRSICAKKLLYLFIKLNVVAKPVDIKCSSKANDTDRGNM